MDQDITEGKKRKLNLLIVLALLTINLLIGIEIVVAQSSLAVSAFGTRGVGNVRGTRVEIWSANPAPNYWFIAGLTSICTTAIAPCNVNLGHGWFETGIIKGMAPTPQNQLQQFVSFRSSGQTPTIQLVFNLGNLSPNSWYTLQTLYSNSAQRWEAWKGSVPIYFNYGLNFTQGNLAMCGAEGEKIVSTQPAVPLNTQCSNMRYKLTGSTNWVQYEYTNPQKVGPYCVYRPYQFGVVGWGPC